MFHRLIAAAMSGAHEDLYWWHLCYSICIICSNCMWSFKKCNTLTCHTSSVLEDCLNLSDPAKLNWGSVLYHCAVCVQLQWCFLSGYFTRVSNFSLLTGLHWQWIWSRDCRILNGGIRRKMKKFHTCSPNYPLREQVCDSTRKFLCPRDWEMCSVRELKYMKLLQWHYVLFNFQWVHQNCLNSCKLSVQCAIITAV